MQSSKSPVTYLLLAISFVLVISLGILALSNRSLRNTIEEQNVELLSLMDTQTEKETAYKELQGKLKEAQTNIVKELTGFTSSELSNDEAIVTSYLNNIFTWTSGDQYDKQRQTIQAIAANGTDSLLNEVMTENIRVAVPEELKGTIKDNDIDINGLKSLLLENQFNRLAWDKSTSADVSYTSRVSYQVYVNEEDLKGEHKTVRTLLFTFKISGIGQERRIVEVKYAFVP